MLAAEIDPMDMLAEDLASFYDDPLGFVLWAFEWGKGELSFSQGPREWQREFLEELGKQVRERGFDGINPVQPIQFSTASGHGIGKSALTAWVILWIMSTRPNAKGMVTANTADQLRTKTWAELAKWHKRSLVAHMFECFNSKGNLSLVSVENPESWRCDALTCREENSEGFAGLHAVDSTPFYIFDEASAVPDVIYEVASGGLTDGEPMMFLFGNPTRNTGRFRETHGKLKHRWITRKIDSRKVEGTNKELFQQWVDDFGEDSDFVKVRVRGEFPSQSSLQFIPSDYVERARQAEAVSSLHEPLILGVDVARFGDDQSVIFARRGRDWRTWGCWKYRQLDTVQLAHRVAEKAGELQADAVFVDAGGVGGGVVDNLRRLNVRGLVPVDFGSKADRSGLNAVGAQGESYLNKRAEMWGAMRFALKEGVAAPDDAELADELVSVEYGFNAKDQIVLESKESMKKRGLASPDVADAVALTYAYPVAPKTLQQTTNPNNLAMGHDFDPYAEM